MKSGRYILAIVIVFILALSSCINLNTLKNKIKHNLEEAIKNNDEKTISYILTRSLSTLAYEHDPRTEGIVPLAYKALKTYKSAGDNTTMYYLEKIVHQDDLPFIESLTCSTSKIDISVGSKLLFTLLKDGIIKLPQNACNCIKNVPIEQDMVSMSILIARVACGDMEAYKYAHETINKNNPSSSKLEFSEGLVTNENKIIWPNCSSRRECAALALAYSPQLDDQTTTLLTSITENDEAEKYAVIALGRHRKAKQKLIQRAKKFSTEAIYALSSFKDKDDYPLFLELYRTFEDYNKLSKGMKNYRFQIALLEALSSYKTQIVREIMEEASNDSYSVCEWNLPVSSCYPVAEKAKKILRENKQD